MDEKKTYICQNTACGKSFTTPLKTLNLTDAPPEPYYACPFCLTKINTPEIKTAQHQIKAQPIETSLEKRKNTNQADSEKSAGCPHHLGYLSERGQKEIPESCLVCGDIINCMLKKMREE